jgi:hypothetical protein
MMRKFYSDGMAMFFDDGAVSALSVMRIFYFVDLSKVCNDCGKIFIREVEIFIVFNRKEMTGQFHLLEMSV